MRLGTSCKDRNLFVPHMDPLYLAVAANGIGQAIQGRRRFHRSASDPLHTRDRESFYELIRNGLQCLLCLTYLERFDGAQRRTWMSFTHRAIPRTGERVVR